MSQETLRAAIHALRGPEVTLLSICNRSILALHNANIRAAWKPILPHTVAGVSHWGTMPAKYTVPTIKYKYTHVTKPLSRWEVFLLACESNHYAYAKSLQNLEKSGKVMFSCAPRGSSITLLRGQLILFACLHDDLELATFLLENEISAPKQINCYTLIYWLCAKGSPEVLQFAINNGYYTAECESQRYQDAQWDLLLRRDGYAHLGQIHRAVGLRIPREDEAHQYLHKAMEHGYLKECATFLSEELGIPIRPIFRRSNWLLDDCMQAIHDRRAGAADDLRTLVRLGGYTRDELWQIRRRRSRW